MTRKFINTYRSCIISLVFLCVCFPFFLLAQTETNTSVLSDFAQRKETEWYQQRIYIEEFARKHNIPIRIEHPDGRIIELVRIENGEPCYFTTDNINAAISTRTNTLWSGGSLGLNLSGSGYNKIGEWDGGGVRTTHREFGDGSQGSRVTQKDTAATLSGHATHVAGTLIAGGYEPAARGMAFESALNAYEWNSDLTEMATAASAGLEVSNHSYSYITGWEADCRGDGRWCWYGWEPISTDEDYYFGYYSSTSRDLDDLAYNAPYYLSVWSAGNDRGDGPGSVTQHWYYNGSSWVLMVKSRPLDGGTSGYDCIGTHGISKNILTIGAVNDVLNYTDPSSVVMSSFSGWGPADDGRIKPDIVANGISLYSSYHSNDSAYTSYSGTSMAAPNTTGTLALLQQYYQQTHSGSSLYAATLKALVINTADECGSNTGPDYQFGWGLLNAKEAILSISDDTIQNVIDHITLTTSITSYSDTVYCNGNEPLKVTIVWTDPAGTPPSPALDPPNVMLVNDLDLKIIKGGTTYYPWKLDKSNPANAATNSTENDVDNVEQVYIASPAAGDYIITVDYDGTLTNGSQSFGIVIRGIDEYSSPPACASIIGPPDGTTNVSLSLSLSWSAGSGYPATGYKLYLGTDGGDTVTPTNMVNGTDIGLVTSYSLAALANNTHYYWKIIPYNASGDASGCDIWEFTTAAGIVAGLWTGNTSTNWDTNSNWDNNAVPTVTTDVIIPAGCTYYPSLNGSLTINVTGGNYVCKSLNIQNGGSLTINDDLDINGIMIVDGSYTCTNNLSFSQNINNGGTLTITGNGTVILGNQTSVPAYTDLWINNGGSLSINGGRLDVDDQVVVVSGGNFSMNSGTLFAHKFGSGSTYGTGGHYGSFYIASGATGNISGGTVKVCGKPGSSGYYAVNIQSSGFDFTGGTLEFLHGDYGAHYDAYINTVPGVELYNVIINKSDNTVYNQSDLDINGDFTMRQETYFTLSSGTTMDVAGNILLESDANSVASFIDLGTLAHSGTATVEQFISEDAWHLVTTPVSGATTNAYLNLYLKDYNETTNNWGPYITSTALPLSVGKGFVVWSGSATTGNATVNLSGTLNTGNQSPAVTYSGASYGYNLIGNPYPSYIDWDAAGWTKTGMDNTIWIWNQTAGNYGTYNGSSGTNDVTNIIPPTQGFFIHATAASPVITMTDNVRVHDNSQVFLKNDAKDPVDLVRFNVKGDTYWDETVISFRPDATNTLNSFDAEKWFSFVQGAPSLYSVKNSQMLSINTLKQITADLTVPVGFIPGAGNNYTLKAEFIESFNPATIIILEDKKENIKIDLHQQKVYPFTSASGDNYDRFALHFGITASVAEQEITDVKIFSSGKSLFVINALEINNARLSVYNILGQEVLSMELGGDRLVEVSLPFITGYYFVKLTSNELVISEKVFVSE